MIKRLIVKYAQRVKELKHEQKLKEIRKTT